MKQNLAMTIVFYMILNPHTYEQNLAMTIVFSMILNPHTYKQNLAMSFVFSMILNPHTYKQNRAMTFVFSMILNPSTYISSLHSSLCSYCIEVKRKNDRLRNLALLCIWIQEFKKFIFRIQITN